MAGHGGGAWKVAYADFVTAMMAFFLVMWITAQSQKVKEAVAKAFNAPYESTTPSRHSRDKNPPATMGPPRLALKNDPAEAASYKPHGQSPRKTNPLNTATLILFPEGSAEISDEGRERLKRLAAWIAGKPQKIEVRGHASRRPLAPGGPFADPWQLCFARCRATADFLREQGIAPERIRMSQAAGNEPFSTRPDPQWQARNSRVEVYLLNEYVQDLVGGDQGTAETDEP
jgi:chemotaxis protein MotB